MKYIEFIQFFTNTNVHYDTQLYDQYLNLIKKSYPNTETDYKDFQQFKKDIKLLKSYWESMKDSIKETVSENPTAKDASLVLEDMKDKIKKLWIYISDVDKNLGNIEVDLDEDFETKLYLCTSNYNSKSITKLEDIKKVTEDLFIEVRNVYYDRYITKLDDMQKVTGNLLNKMSNIFSNSF